MIELVEVQKASASHFLPFVLPEFRSLLLHPSPSWVAIGAIKAGRPIALALATGQEGSRTAHLLSVVVAENEQRTGIGKSSLQALEASLRKKGYQSVSAEFITHSHPSSIEASFLTACGYAAPQPGIHIWSGPIELTRSISWIETCRLPQNYSYASWASMTLADRERLQRGRGVWYPPILDPFAEEEAIDPERSLILRYSGEIIGWIILEVFDPDTLLFKTMFVHPRYQRTGRGIALMTEAGKRTLEESIFSNGIFFVEAENEAMVQFMDKRLVHPDLQKQVLWRTFHLL